MRDGTPFNGITYTNEMGIEAEYLLRDADQSLVYPGDYGLPADGFPILGEIRGEPGTQPESTVANFIKEYLRISRETKDKNLTIDLTGYTKVSPKIYAEFSRRMGNKEISKCKNINPDIDLLELSDDIIDPTTGKVVTKKISCGLHIHFSSSKSHTVIREKLAFTPVKIPLWVGEAEARLDLYRKEPITETKEAITVSVSRITVPVIRHIVSEYDRLILPNYKYNEPFKYRNPGFYETKNDGRFEYRSLPFNQTTYNELIDIVEFGYRLLQNI